MKRKSKFPFVSLLVVNYNGKNILEICLPSLFKLQYPKDRYEVVIVDNGSTDGSIEFLKERYPKMLIVQNNKNMGYVGINSGLKHCRGEYIYFLNNDLTLDKNCLKYLIQEIEKDNSIGMVAHNAVNFYDKSIVSGGTWVSRTMYCGHYKKDDDKPTKIIPYLGGGMIRKSIISKYGYLFDPDYFIYAEDLDLGLRIRLIGMKIVLVTKAVCYHMHSVTTKKFSTPAKNTFLLERNLLMTFLKIFSVKNLLLYAPIVVLARLGTIIKDVLTLKMKNAFARIAAMGWIVVHLMAITGKRKEAQKLRSASDSFILEVFSEKYILKKPFLI